VSLSVRERIFTGIGEFIRRAKRVPGEAREKYEQRLKIADPSRTTHSAVIFLIVPVIF